MGLKDYEVPWEKLRLYCDPEIFDFECTKELTPLREFIGQDRATKAVQFGLNMGNSGYNIYVAGITGTGKTSMVKTYIEELIKRKAEEGTTFEIEDWCYLYNFKEPDRPQIVALPRGWGNRLQRRVSRLLTRVREDLGTAFSSEDYQAGQKKIVEDGRSRQQKLYEQIAEEARRQGFLFQMSPAGPALVPLVDDKPIDEQEYMALDEETRKKLQAKRDEFQQKSSDNFEKAHNVEQEIAEQLEQNDKSIAEFTVSKLFTPLLKECADQPTVKQYLLDLKEYALDNLVLFKKAEEPMHPVFGVPASQVVGGRDPFLPFEVNVFVDNSRSEGPPVITETNPNFGNLFGKIERRFIFGGYLSDHTTLKAGAVSLANGGYLLLNARDVLINVGVWATLKRMIKDHRVSIEDPAEQFGLIAPQGLRPEPMPIDVKIVMIGDALTYQLLSIHDEDFWEIFKVKADFDFEIDRNEKNMFDYAAFICGCCEACQAKHLDRSGVARVIEFSSRLVGDKEKLSSRFGQIKELIEESNHWALRDNADLITAKHVQKAIEERLFRHNLAEERHQELIDRRTIMIDVEGEVTGQVNGLSVLSLGDLTFGKPARITAKTFLGRRGVINIERESELSGPIHNKGVMILGGYLGWKYAQETPLSLSASICFEQSYSGIDGDSASSTELYAILSSLADVPIRQGIAVTGSVNQKGDLQPIGGVNYKIEGFFQTCESQGLTGDQGVLIPYQNLRNLMLRDDVIQAVKDGKFNVYAAKSVDEGIEILTGVPAGDRKPDGTYPQGTINRLVEDRLKGMAHSLRRFHSREKGDTEDGEDTQA